MNQVVLYAQAGYFPDGYVAEYSTTKIDHLDFLNKRIYLKAGTTTYHPVDDLYKEVRYIRAHDFSLRNMRMPITAEGAISKGGGKFTPRLAILRYGWRIVPQNATHSLYISGEQITDDGQSGPACMNTAVLDAGVSVTIHYEPATAEMLSTVNYQNVVTGTALTAEQTANAVWGAATRTLTALGMTPEQIAVAVLAAAQATPIHSDAKKMNGAAILGTGASTDLWRGA